MQSFREMMRNEGEDWYTNICYSLEVNPRTGGFHCSKYNATLTSSDELNPAVAMSCGQYARDGEVDGTCYYKKFLS